MNARRAIKKKLERSISKVNKLDSDHNNIKNKKKAMRIRAQLSSYQSEFKSLVPEEYKEAHSYDISDDELEDFKNEVLEIYDLYPNLRDAICHLFGKYTDAERDFIRNNLAIIIAIVALVTSIIA